jgi:hypothetical protein
MLVHINNGKLIDIRRQLYVHFERQVLAVTLRQVKALGQETGGWLPQGAFMHAAGWEFNNWHS